MKQQIYIFFFQPKAGIRDGSPSRGLGVVYKRRAAVGYLFNFVMGALFVGVAGFVYKRSKTRRSALIGAGLGALVMAVVSVPYNYFIVYPAYVVLYHLPLEAIIGMYQAINPSVDGLLTCLITFNFPFTLFKGLLDAALCFLIYKPLSGVLHGRK